MYALPLRTLLKRHATLDRPKTSRFVTLSTPHGTRCRPGDAPIAHVVHGDDIREIGFEEAGRLAQMHSVGPVSAAAVLGAHLAAGGVVGTGHREQVAALRAATSEARAA